MTVSHSAIVTVEVVTITFAFDIGIRIGFRAAVAAADAGLPADSACTRESFAALGGVGAGIVTSSGRIAAVPTTNPLAGRADSIIHTGAVLRTEIAVLCAGIACPIATSSI